MLTSWTFIFATCARYAFEIRTGRFLALQLNTTVRSSIRAYATSASGALRSEKITVSVLATVDVCAKLQTYIKKRKITVYV